MAVISMAGEAKYVAYATESQVIGIVKLPLDGNPFKSMGVIAHPGKVRM